VENILSCLVEQVVYEFRPEPADSYIFMRVRYRIILTVALSLACLLVAFAGLGLLPNMRISPQFTITF
jgi:hypothetical protein